MEDYTVTVFEPGAAVPIGDREVKAKSMKGKKKQPVTSVTRTGKQPLGFTKNNQSETAIDGNSEVTPVTSSKFIISDQGLFYLEEKDDSPGQKWLSSYMRVIAFCHAEDNKNWGVVLEYRDRLGVTRDTVIPYAVASSPHELTKLLVDLGIRISHRPRTSHLIWQYFDIPHDRTRTVVLTKECGWHKESFVMPGMTLGEQKFRLDGDCDPFTTQGTLDQWRSGVSCLCAGNSRLTFALSAAFTGPILGLLKRESFGIHFQGTSSEGKSTVGVYLVGSVWSDPELFKVTWRATLNGLEGKAAERNHMLLPLDELKQIQPEDAIHAIYTIANGTGKARAMISGRARKQLQWTEPFISTGEISLADYVASGGLRYHGGLDVRLIQLLADAGTGNGIFECLHGFENGDKLAKHIAERSKSCFGTAGIAFVEKLIKNLGVVSGRIDILGNEFRTAIRDLQLGAQAQRVAGHFALIAATGELATEYGVTGWPAGESIKAARHCFESWLKTRGTTGELEDLQVLAHIRRFIETYGESRFIQGYEDLTAEEISEQPHVTRTPQQRMGYSIETSSKDRLWYVFPGAFKTEVCAGFHWDRVRKLLIERSWVRVQKDGRIDSLVRIPGCKKATRMIVLTSKVLEDEL